MNQELHQKALAMKKNRVHKKQWQMLLRALALCVVFCTTYLLVLPAITMQSQPICGLEGHVHSAECWSQPETVFENCGIPAGVTVVHQHSELCKNEAGELICPLEEKTTHTHDEGCLTRTQTLNCPAGHVHSEDCRKTETVLSCTLAEAPGHTHSESCTGTQTVQVCTLEDHEHGEDCFAEEPVICQIPESEGHAHGEGCYTLVEIPCTETAPAEHIHEESCYLVTETLTCGLEETDGTAFEHIHTQSCLTVRQSVLLCTLAEHIHEPTCYRAEEVPAVDDK